MSANKKKNNKKSRKPNLKLFDKYKEINVLRSVNDVVLIKKKLKQNVKNIEICALWNDLKKFVKCPKICLKAEKKSIN